MLASTSPLSLCLPSGHANMEWIFPARGRQCWRRPPRKPFVFRRVTPTWPGFSRLAGASVGVDLPTTPLSSVETRQHNPDFPDLQTPLLASASPQGLISSSGHANMVRFFLARGLQCWRRPSRKAFIFRQVTPTWPGFSRPAGAFVGAALPAKPLSSVRSRQHGPAFPG